MFSINLKNWKRHFSLKHGMFFWYQYYKILFFFGFVIVLSLGGYFWYSNLYQYHWSDTQKNEFIVAHFKETVFKKKAFEQLVTDLKDRATRYQEAVSLSRDIFSGKDF